MRRPNGSHLHRLRVAATLATALGLANITAVAAGKGPSKPPPTASPVVTVAIAPTGTLEPSMEYAVVDVTVTCTSGWTVSRGSLYVLQPDDGGAGSFSAGCTGTPQVVRARAVNGNRWQLGSASAQAYVTIQRNGTQVNASSTRTIQLDPGVTARVASQGQLTGSTGGGVRIAIDVACPIGATPEPSFISVAQDGTAQGSASFTPVCDRQTRTVVLSIAASRGTFHTGSATAEAFVTVSRNGQGFYGIDSRAITLLESSTGDTTPPTTPTGLWANTFGDAEIWLSWNASSDNATPTGLIVYEVWLNGRFDQPIGGGQTRAILYGDLGVLNTIEVFAVDGAGNRSAPATVQVDFRS